MLDNAPSSPTNPLGYVALRNGLLLFFVIGPLVAVATAMVLLWNQYVFATDIALLLVFYVISGIGITTGFHRMLTHRAFKTSPLIRDLFVIAGCQALESNPISWVAIHIHHHAESDEDGDPHSPLAGFFHSHIGWMFRYIANEERYAPALLRDARLVRVSNLWMVWYGIGLVICYLVGGWTGVLWGGLVRTALTHHITWSINSVCHLYGSRTYKTEDQSKNNWIFGLLGFGEGWHNNHHAFPNSAKLGLKWWQIDIGGYIILTLEKLGLAWDVHRPTPEQRARAAA
jgi:stearoyl-CoA desaturase (Delta-9 desaturase)